MHSPRVGVAGRAQRARVNLIGQPVVRFTRGEHPRQGISPSGTPKGRCPQNTQCKPGARAEITIWGQSARLHLQQRSNGGGGLCHASYDDDTHGIQQDGISTTHTAPSPHPSPQHYTWHHTGKPNACSEGCSADISALDAGEFAANDIDLTLFPNICTQKASTTSAPARLRHPVTATRSQSHCAALPP